MTIHDEFVRKTPNSAFWAERARATMPDGVTADTRVFDPHGLYIRQAQGVHKVDVDGNRYLDFFGGHAALVLGHGHPRVNAAITSALANGIQYAASHPMEVRWAERIKRHVKSAEKVRFVGSGTEATLLAMRMARALTGRSKILRISTHYHGWHDFSASGYNSHFDGQPAPGVLSEVAQNTILVPPDNYEALKLAFEQFGSEIAAMIAEPAGTHFGIIPVSDDFIKEGAKLSRAYGALFILDEVISGFRVSTGGMQGLLEITPDLTCMAKAAAGGLPGGLVCGTEQAMSVLSQKSPNKVLHQGTFTGNPVTAAAAVAAIDEISEMGICDQISELGEHARKSLNNLFAARGLEWIAYGRFSALHLMPGISPTETDLSKITRGEYQKPSAALIANMRMGLMLEGIDIGGRGTVFMNAQHNKGHIEELVTAFDSVITRLAEEKFLTVKK